MVKCFPGQRYSNIDILGSVKFQILPNISAWKRKANLRNIIIVSQEVLGYGGGGEGMLRLLIGSTIWTEVTFFWSIICTVIVLGS